MKELYPWAHSRHQGVGSPTPNAQGTTRSLRSGSADGDGCSPHLQDPVQPGPEQQPGQPWRHVAQDESPAGLQCPPMGADQHAEPGRVEHLDPGDVDEQLADSEIHSVVQDVTDVGNCTDIDASA